MDSSNENISNQMEEEAAYSFTMELVSGSVLPMVLKSAIELDLLELIKKDGSASASQLAAQLPTNNPQAANMIDRILRFLAHHSVLICNQPDGGAERRYSLAPRSKFLTKNQDGVSMAPISLMIQDRVFIETWYHLKDAVLEGGIPFDRAHGMNAFEYPGTDPRFNKVFNQAMYEQSTIFMKKIIEIYKGFEGLESLVDVGGGIGASLKIIISKYPSIKAINFDLPHVIQNAPPHPDNLNLRTCAGIEHIGGDMFVSVPKADAIFMKWIIHDWSDSHCQKLLKNCYEALPINGKVIIAESILPDDPKKDVTASGATRGDVVMMTFNPGGKERTEKEFQAFAIEAGFKHLIKVCYAFNIWIMELHK